MSDLKSTSIPAFVEAKNIDAISDVEATPENGYPYLIFYSNDKHKSGEFKGRTVTHLIMFSKGASELVSEGDAVETVPFKDLQIVEYIDDNGDERIKLARKGEGGATKVSALDLG